MSRRRATLEQIAFGEGTTPTERLRAIELLRELEPVERPSETERALRLALEIPADALDGELDGLIASEIVAAVESGGGNYPITTELLRALAKRWAAELADADRIEAEIAERAEARAIEIYTERGCESIRQTLDNAAETAAEGPQAVATALSRSKA